MNVMRVRVCVGQGWKWCTRLSKTTLMMITLTAVGPIQTHTPPNTALTVAAAVVAAVVPAPANISVKTAETSATRVS
jgi:hypothetical protein|eukprot:COSAG06_NODE_3438_length_5349_cov_206.431238_4_plen_77_part_00